MVLIGDSILQNALVIIEMGLYGHRCRENGCCHNVINVMMYRQNRAWQGLWMNKVIYKTFQWGCWWTLTFARWLSHVKDPSKTVATRLWAVEPYLTATCSSQRYKKCLFLCDGPFRDWSIPYVSIIHYVSIFTITITEAGVCWLDWFDDSTFLML